VEVRTFFQWSHPILISIRKKDIGNEKNIRFVKFVANLLMRSSKGGKIWKDCCKEFKKSNNTGIWVSIDVAIVFLIRFFPLVPYFGHH
jgi:hypothetical protein